MRRFFTICIILLGMMPSAQGQNWSRKLLRAIRKAPNSWGMLRGARPPGLIFHSMSEGINPLQSAVRIENNQIFSDAWRVALRSSFYVEPNDFTFNHVFSGVVFQSEQTGKLFGVISTHALSLFSTNLLGALQRNFTLLAFDEQGNSISVPARVVQLGAFGTLDVSLIEFDSSAQHYLTPARIAKQPAMVGQELFSQGFTSGYTVYIPGRQVTQINSFGLRTTLPGPDHLRRGLCGAPLFNDAGELVAIHTGSKIAGDISKDDIGYATHAQLLEKLVAAYENGNEIFIPFDLLDGTHVTDLRVDEYVSNYTLRNEQGRAVWSNTVPSKFPFNHVDHLIKKFSPRYMDITIGRIKWDDANGEFVAFEKEIRRERYDFHTQQITELKSLPNEMDDWYNF